MLGDLKRFSINDVTLEAANKKRRLLTRAITSFAAIMTVHTVLIFLIMPGFTSAKLVTLIALGLLYVLSWISRYGSLYNTSAVSLVAIIILGGFGSSVTNGGVEGFVAPILLTAPISAALFLGARGAVISAAIVLCVFALLLVMQLNGFIRTPSYSATATAFGSLLLLATSASIGAAGMGHFASESEQQIKSLTKAQSDLIEIADQLHFHANHDSLTGLANRSQLNARFRI